MIYTFANLELDTRSFELRRAGTNDVVAMEPQVFDVLRFLVEHADRVVTKEELLDSVWGTRFVTESALTSRIKDARKAVGDDGRSQHIIRTVHGRGYRFIAAITFDDGDRLPSSTRRPAGQLLERDDELAVLTSALDDARSHGTGSVVLVGGEAGFGKTSLVRAFTDAARAEGVRVLVGGCDDMITPRTMGPIRDIAHGIEGPLEEAFRTDADVEQVFATLRDVLAEETTVLVVEDVHWADDATLDVVRFLARRISDLETVLVATYREEDVPAGHRLRQVLGSLAGPSVRRMVLAPLSPDATAALAADTEIAADELYAATRGNPFFVTEVLATGELRVPPTVRDAVLSRVDALSITSRNLLEHAAVVPSRAERWLLDALVPAAHAAMTEAEHAGVLAGDERHVWFRHELARHAVEESLTAAARTHANQRVLEVLETHDDIEPARLVHHAERAGDSRALITYAPMASEDAIRLGAYSQAVHSLELLLAHEDALSKDAIAVAASRRSYALYMMNRFADSARFGWQAVVAAEAAGDREVLVDTLLWLSRTLYWSDGPRAASAASERALPIAEELGDPARLASAHTELARSRSDLVAVGPVAEPAPAVVEHAERALEFAEALGDSYLRCHALQYRGIGRISVDDARGLDDLKLAVEFAQLEPRDEMPTRACVNAAGGAFRAGCLDEAERYAKLGLERASGGEFSAGAYRLELTLQGVRFCRGEWDDAEAGLRALVEWQGEPGIMRALAASVLVRLLARQGRHDEAAEVLRPAVAATANSEEIALVGPVAAAALEAAWLSDRASEMPAIAKPALTLATALAHRTTASELTWLLRHAGLPADTPAHAVGPWAHALDGRWQRAADAWAARGCRYERALELALAPDKGARAEGCTELRSLGATATLAFVG
jgi:DNA-binding winged helix-turn-helix (wHTH) protein